MNCNWVEAVLSVLIIVFAWLQTSYSQWIIIVAAALLLIHTLSCKNCRACGSGNMSKMNKSRK